MIGGSRQSVNRLLADFVATGLLRFEGDVLVIPDSPRLGGGRATMSDGRRRASGRCSPPSPDALAAAERVAPVPDDDAPAGHRPDRGDRARGAGASIALHDADHRPAGLLAAAGTAAGDVVGLTIDSAAGIAGYAFTTGQPLAIADVAADPRFDRSVAEATGYVPALAAGGAARR